MQTNLIVQIMQTCLEGNWNGGIVLGQVGVHAVLFMDVRVTKQGRQCGNSDVSEETKQ